MLLVRKKEIIPKHRDVFIFYTILIKHLGDKAKEMTRGQLYQMVSDHFYINPNMVTRIINRLHRERYSPNRCDIEEFKTNVNKLSGIINDYPRKRRPE